jgi:FtsZ-binding cell division protein ZapB
MMLMKTPMSELPKASAAELAAGVKKSREQIALEAEHEELRRQRNQLQENMRALIGQLGKVGGSDQVLLEKRVKALSSEKSSIDDRIYELRRRLAPLREVHANRVRETLAPREAEAAKQLLAGVLQMRAAITLLAECSDEVMKQGGGLDWNKPMLPDAIGHLEAYARRLTQPTTRMSVEAQIRLGKIDG